MTPSSFMKNAVLATGIFLAELGVVAPKPAQAQPVPMSQTAAFVTAEPVKDEYRASPEGLAKMKERMENRADAPENSWVEYIAVRRGAVDLAKPKEMSFADMIAMRDAGLMARPQGIAMGARV